MASLHLKNTIDLLRPLQNELRNHKLYQHLNTKDRIVLFMSHHVFCVWDFMNLLKTLQNNLTCTTVPWRPYSNARVSRLINDIVLEEESDIIDGVTTSHFAYYMKAMQTLTPNNTVLDSFLRDLDVIVDYKSLISREYIPQNVQQFLNVSFESIQKSVLHTASAFTFGREALVPDLFEPIMNNSILNSNETLKRFDAYLKRHIELDGQSHSLLAYEMVEELCKTDEDWQIVNEQAVVALKARLDLWDSVLLQIQRKS
ncbi:heme oxygenase [Candidatus Marinamargulisbacteria bacterium SCGC AG-343-D04]|nr:heme oxygenase [Candidatus Marinamargulisbacteria bacterium SCGC AG-343-D04]